jgi:hypothetical protein
MLGVAHAQLVDVDIAGLDPGHREPGENLPADGALTDSRRPAQPQDRDQIADHHARHTPEPMLRIVTPAFSRVDRIGQPSRQGSTRDGYR